MMWVGALAFTVDLFDGFEYRKRSKHAHQGFPRLSTTTSRKKQISSQII